MLSIKLGDRLLANASNNFSKRTSEDRSVFTQRKSLLSLLRNRDSSQPDSVSPKHLKQMLHHFQQNIADAHSLLQEDVPLLIRNSSLKTEKRKLMFKQILRRPSEHQPTRTF